MSDTPEEVLGVLAQLGGPNAEFYSGEAADLLRNYAELLEQHAALKARVKELEGLAKMVMSISYRWQWPDELEDVVIKIEEALR